MRLRDYLQKHRITQLAFGQRMSPPVSQAKVNHWLNGSRRVSLVEALQIQRITDGEVALEDLITPHGNAHMQAANDAPTAQQGVASA